MTHAGRTEMDNGDTVSFDKRFNARVNILIGTDEARQLAEFGRRRVRGDGRVDHRHAHFLQRRVEALGRDWIGGRGVDNDLSLAQVRPQIADDLLHHVGIAEAEEKDITCLGEGLESFRFHRPSRDQILDRNPITVPDHRKLVALRHQVGGHAVPHQPHSDKTDFRHVPVPFCARQCSTDPDDLS